MAEPHTLSFFRAGGIDQLSLRSGRDLAAVAELDPKLWVAIAMPVKGVELDAKTLGYVDTDNDGRIRVPEIIAAVKWVLEVVADPDELLKKDEGVELSALKKGPVRAAAKRILEDLGKAELKRIELSDVADTAKVFAQTRFNGDGIVPVDAADDDAQRKLIEDIIATHDSVPDRSGKPGIDKAKLDAFFAEAKAFVEWWAKPTSDEALRPVDDSAAAADAYESVRAKIDDYFARCRLVEFDPRATALVNGAESELASLAAKDVAQAKDDVAKLPLARVEAGRPLPLEAGVNPAWADAIARFATLCVKPLLGHATSTLSAAEWLRVGEKFAPFLAWRASKPAGNVEKLGAERLREIAAGDGQAALAKLIEDDAALAKDYEQLSQVEKALLFKRDLLRLLNNFVAFAEFYRKKNAVFLAGQLFIDGRSCQLCFEVADAAKHGALAGFSNAHLLYCDCTRPNGEKMTIAAAITAGNPDFLIVGRNGVFYDRQGRDWDATITKVVANPISVREAFWSPYKKLARMIEEQISKRAAAKEAESEAKLTSTAETTANIDQAKKDKPPVAAPKKIDVGTVAAIGVAVGGIGAMVVGILSVFLGLGLWMPIGIVAILLLISGPSMLLAYLKLRQRNLGPILDASGWAINGRAKINVPFGGAMTTLAKLPKDAECSLDDPYAEKQRPWKLYLSLALLIGLGLLWYFGQLDSLLPPVVQSSEVLGNYAPGK